MLYCGISQKTKEGDWGIKCTTLEEKGPHLRDKKKGATAAWGLEMLGWATMGQNQGEKGEKKNQVCKEVHDKR